MLTETPSSDAWAFFVDLLWIFPLFDVARWRSTTLLFVPAPPRHERAREWSLEDFDSVPKQNHFVFNQESKGETRYGDTPAYEGEKRSRRRCSPPPNKLWVRLKKLI